MKMKYREHKEESSNYLEITIYNKTKETEQRIASGKASKDELIRYKNVIRTEIKVKNGKLNSNKSQDKLNNKVNIRTKNLCNYYNADATKTYYSNNAQKIYGTETYYRIDVAIKIICDNEKLKDKMKEKLCSLIKLVNSLGYTEAKQIWIDTFSLGTYKNHIKKIRELGINVVTFDEVTNGKKTPYESIPNFSLLDNAEIEFIRKNKFLF